MNLDELQESFQELSKEEQLEYLIELGSNLKEFPEDLKTKDRKVAGCVSEVFIDVSLNKNTLVVQGTSTSLIIKGFVYIFTTLYTGKTVEEALPLKEKINNFVISTNLAQSTIPSRANAVGNILNTIANAVSSLQ